MDLAKSAEPNGVYLQDSSSALRIQFSAGNENKRDTHPIT